MFDGRRLMVALGVTLGFTELLLLTAPAGVFVEKWWLWFLHWVL